MVAGHLQEKRGMFYMVLSYPAADGKRKSKWISTGLPVKGNKRKAEAMLLETRRNFVSDEIPASNTLYFHVYLLQWLEIAKSTVAPTTYASYRQLLNASILPYFRKYNIQLADLKPSDIQAFYLEQLKRVKANTVIHYHAIIHRALKYAVKTGLLPSNPADRVDRPKAERFVGSHYESDEIKQLFDISVGTANPVWRILRPAPRGSNRIEMGCHRF